MQIKSPVTAIFNQLTAGDHPRLNFPRSSAQQQTFLTLAAHVHREAVRQIELDPYMETELVLQLGRHCVKYGYLKEDKIGAFMQTVPDLVEAIVTRPGYLHRSQSISSILNKHAQEKAQKAADLRRRFMAADNDKYRVTTLYEGVDGYRLVELHTPAHLKAETLVLKHCIGSRHNLAALAQKGISPGSAQEDNYLQYAIKIRKGECRIFSLRAPDGMPVATLCYDKKSQSIIELEGDEPHMKRSSPHFAPLCRALAALQTQMPIGKIHNLPPLMARNEYCTRNGDFGQITHGLPADMLYGSVVVPADISACALHALANNPRLLLNISELDDTKRLPKHIKADLIFATGPGGTADLSHVETAADILSECREIDLTGLRSCHTLHLPWVQRLKLPVLVESESIVSGCTSIEAPKFRTCGNISLPNIMGDVCLPQLQRTLNFDIASNSTRPGETSLPSLRHSLVFSCGGRRINAPALQYADELNIKQATQVNLSSLVAVGDVRAAHLGSLTLPELITAAIIDIYLCRQLIAPKLKSADELYVHARASIKAPLLPADTPIKYEGSEYTAARYNGP